MTPLPTLGGSGNFIGNTACAVNNLDQVVGQSDLPGDQTGHRFLWQNGVMTDLGALPGDIASIPATINDAGKVVGAGFDENFNLRAFRFISATGGVHQCKRPDYWIRDDERRRDSCVYGHASSFRRDHGTRSVAGAKPFQTILSSYGLSAAQSTSLSPGPLTYSWTLAQGYPSAGILGASSATPIIQFPHRGTYQLILVVTDSTGATATTTVTVQYV